MRYDYVCNACLAKAEARKGGRLDNEEMRECMFETEHAMNPTAKELKERTQCPVCNGHDTQKTLVNSEIHTYVAGNCFLDKKGALRDMNVYKLTQDDPYGHMRQPGEVDDMVSRFKRAGKHGFETAKHVDMGALNKPPPKKNRKKISDV